MNDKQRPRYWIVVLVTLLILGLFSVMIAGFIGLFFVGEEPVVSGNVAVIDIQGAISVTKDGVLTSGVASSTDIVKLIEKADKDDRIKAMVFMIESPGGSAVASDEIATAIKSANKTTVAVIRDIGTSGAYWIASSTRHVIANRASFTGSIGVIASYIEIPGLLEHYNVTYRRLVAGKYKDMGSPLKELTPEEEEIFQQSLDELHEIFIQEVATNRNMSYDDVKKLATGEFFTGLKAKRLGLVDELGGKKEAKAYLEKALNTTVVLMPYKKPKTLFETLTTGVSEQAYVMGRGIGDSLTHAESTLTVRT